MKIPKGRVTSYGEIAKAIGRPKASRAIGQALNKNPYPITIPCHRIVMSTGSLGGYKYGQWKKSELLAEEGVKVSKEKILEFDKIYFKFDQL